jgi:hypothetical protein
MSAWMDAMLRGDFAAAWEISDAVLRERAGQPCWELPRHLQWIWNGTPLDGKRVLIRCYHGLGDTLQFIRYAPLVRARAAEVIVWAPPALLPILATMQGIDRLAPLHDGAFEGDYDIDVEVMELPHLFHTTLETIPAEVPYLHAEPLALADDRDTVGPLVRRGSSPAAGAQERTATGPAPVTTRTPSSTHQRVGIVWRAGDWDERRSIPFELIRPLADIPNVRLCVLQRDVAPNEEDRRFIRLPHVNDILGTARLMRALDLVITVDSMTAHLAGALAVPVWTLLPKQCDWRWMSSRSDSPWYPTMRLFRQQRDGDWPAVVAVVIAGLCGAAADQG